MPRLALSSIGAADQHFGFFTRRHEGTTKARSFDLSSWLPFFFVPSCETNLIAARAALTN